MLFLFAGNATGKYIRSQLNTNAAATLERTPKDNSNFDFRNEPRRAPLPYRRNDMNKEYAHKMGYECGINGANLKNCHFTIFSRKEFTKAWEEGKRKAEVKQAKENEIMKSALAKARDKWFLSDDGKECREGQASGQYLQNRLERAFLAGANISSERIEELKAALRNIVYESKSKAYSPKIIRSYAEQAQKI